jgi:hypothetical protein
MAAAVATKPYALGDWRRRKASGSAALDPAHCPDVCACRGFARLALIRAARAGLPDHVQIAPSPGGDGRGKASMKALLMLLVASLLSLGNARAALIETASSLGPASAVLDTGSGLEWLKLPFTRDLSINQVRAGMAPGGSFEGFRYATQDEFSCGLLAPQTGFGCGDYSASTQEGRVRAFLALFGSGFSETSLYSVFSPERSREFGWLEGYAAAFGIRFFYYAGAPFPVEYDSQLVGVPLDRPQTHWLVRQAQDVREVPEPPMPALLGAGLLMLLMLPAGRRKAALFRFFRR